MRFVLAALPLLLGFLVFYKVRPRERLSRRLSLWVAFGGAVAGVVAVHVERAVLGWTDLSLEVSRSGVSGALLATFLLAAPQHVSYLTTPCWRDNPTNCLKPCKNRTPDSRNSLSVTY